MENTDTPNIRETIALIDTMKKIRDGLIQDLDFRLVIANRDSWSLHPDTWTKTKELLKQELTDLIQTNIQERIEYWDEYMKEKLAE